MKDIQPIYILIIIVAIGVGVYMYNSAQERRLVKDCLDSAIVPSQEADCLN